MSPARTAPLADQRAQLLDVAMRMLEESGPEALQARKIAAEVGGSTQAIYTAFGGMPGLFEALAAEGLERLAQDVRDVPLSDDAVQDFLAQGGAYAEWALGHPQLYRLMFGLTGTGLRLHPGLDVTIAGRVVTFPEGQAGLDVMIGSVERVIASGRIRNVDPIVTAGQFLSATHGYALLEIAGAFGDQGKGLQVITELAINLFVGLGDSREAVERSAQAALAAHAQRLSD
jgi:AcrR family transcriptional regulator